MKYINKTSGSIRLAALLAGAALFGLASQNALAAGTASGTPITNSATLTYSVAAVVQPVVTGTSTAFLVDEKINLVVAAAATTNVVPNDTAKVLTYTVTNTANSLLDFTLSIIQPAAGDQFDATACNIYAESGGGAGYQAGVDTAAFIDELAADATRAVYVVCNIPNTVVNTNIANVDLVATAAGTFTGANGIYVATPGVQGAVINETVGAETPGIVDIVFIDAAGTAAGDVIHDKTHSNRGSYSVVSAVLSITKTTTLLCGPVHFTTNPKNIPGAISRWTITISNDPAGANATLSNITDALGATLAHDANLVVPTAVLCDSATGAPENALGKGFKVTVPVARDISPLCAAATSCFFTSANDGDGIDNNLGSITATFGANLLPIDGAHGATGLLKPGESVSIIFNTTLQ